MDPDSTGNTLLDRFPLHSRERILRMATTVPVGVGDLIADQGEPVDHVYFPRSGVASLVVPFLDGRTVEATTIGREGMVGFETVLGGREDLNRRYVWQVPGIAVRVGADDFRALAARDGEIRDVVLAHVPVVFAQATQTAACNARHGVRQRCAKWLLTTHDRVEGDEFALSHEFLAIMVGVRRASVTEVAGAFKAQGSITYERAKVTILDRASLEREACECYEAIRMMYFDDLPSLRVPA